MYKNRWLLLFVFALVLTGCTKIDNNIDNIVSATMTKEIGFVNTVSTGYELYIPIGVMQLVDNEYNQKFKIADTHVYLYVDMISYYYKNNSNYFEKEGFDYFYNADNPSWGPKIDVDFDSITYYKKRTEELTNDWEKISCAIRNEFRDLGVIDAENKYLDGIGAQYDSEVIYHNMIKELVDKNVIFLDTDSALKQYPDLYFL